MLLNRVTKKQFIITLLLAIFAATLQISGQDLENKLLEQLQFRHIGPIGNRIISVSGVEGDPMTYFVGAASGGIWKTNDGGLNWKPVFDKYPVHAIGALAVAPSDPQVIYAGTGEGFIRSNVSIGNGVWKSMDGGENWSHLGLDSTGRISR
ncbi:MAG: glycosyl hydrolase, partial [Saprospiraceae bacterium]|nr:glycosyl hydrolase [Saprospiraceae bacterium]